jgi:hypothetical protein
MTQRPAPADAPSPGLRLRPLGGITWLKDRRYFLADDGSVWCREASYGGYGPARWLRVGPEECNLIEVEGRTLTARIADLAGDDPGSTVQDRPKA